MLCAHIVMSNLNPSEDKTTPLCSSCGFVLSSETSDTKLRCGLSYFRSSPLMRKFQLMQHFPVVKPDNACESWAHHED